MKFTLNPKRLTRAAILALFCWLAAPGQGANETSVLTIAVVDEHGNPFQKDVIIHISAKDFELVRGIRTGSSIELAYGTYTISGAGGYAGSSEHFIRVYQPRTHIVLSLLPIEYGDRIGRDRWVIRGTVKPAEKAKGAVVRLISLYADLIDDGIVGDDGKFTLNAWAISPYKLWILIGGKVVAEQDVDVEYGSARELPPIEIQIPDSRPAK